MYLTKRMVDHFLRAYFKFCTPFGWVSVSMWMWTLLIIFIEELLFFFHCINYGNKFIYESNPSHKFCWDIDCNKKGVSAGDRTNDDTQFDSKKYFFLLIQDVFITILYYIIITVCNILPRAASAVINKSLYTHVGTIYYYFTVNYWKKTTIFILYKILIMSTYDHQLTIWSDLLCYNLKQIMEH